MAEALERNQRMLRVGDTLLPCIDRGAGDPIVVFSAGADALAPMIDKLADSHRVIALDVSNRAPLNQDQLAQKLPNALAGVGIDRFSVVGIQSGARSALALAITAPPQIDKLILISPQITASESPDLAAVKAPTLVLVATRDADAIIEAGRLCRERISSCHLSFVYDPRKPVGAERLEAYCDPIFQFLEEGEQFIIVRESQVIRP